MFKSIVKSVAISTAVYVGAIYALAYLVSWFLSDPFYAIFVPCYICTLAYMFFLPMLAWSAGYKKAKEEAIRKRFQQALESVEA